MLGHLQRARRLDRAHRGVQRRIALSVSFARAAIAAAGCGVFALGLAGSAQAADTVPNGYLNAVSCSSPTACTAVGTGYGTTYATRQPLAERWNGVRWTVQTIPSHPTGSTTAVLSGVACPSASVCFAVGSLTVGTGPTYVLAERWNGKSWTAQPIPNPAGPTNPVLSAVSCTSVTRCTAVGSYTSSAGQTVPLAERWNGTKWEIQSMPVPSGGYGSALGVSCSSVSACTAVGNGIATAPLAERWNGLKWVVQPTPVLGNPGPYNMAGGGFAGVSCPSARACFALGTVDYGGGVSVPLTERWNDGTSWTVQPNPGPGWNTMTSVSCTSTIACIIVGNISNSAQSATLAERWNGTSWTIQTTPNPSGPYGPPQLSGVSCTSSNVCTAVGGSSAFGNGLTLAERWNGTTWVIQPTP